MADVFIYPDAPSICEYIRIGTIVDIAAVSAETLSISWFTRRARVADAIFPSRFVSMLYVC
jgi:hypothetical protein